MSAVKDPVRPIRTKQSKTSEYCEIKARIEAAPGRLHTTNALLIATQFAANHECRFDAKARVGQDIEALHGLCREAAP
jgi:hypothetical protein